ncbi:MAG: TatD family hydrolase [Xanthomonadales bacterium]|nr:TatD family hydrolase [Xanthomonadales bacterium]
MPLLFDSHCHLDVAEFNADRDAVLARARAAGVCLQLLPAIDAAGWPALRDLCAATPGLHPAFGLHPLFMDRHRPAHLKALRDWLQRERPVAVGECGLDFWTGNDDAPAQMALFEGQLRLAREFDLPVVLHARKALDAVIAALRRTGGLRGVVHSFSGSPQQARQLWDLGFHLGIGGPVTYPRARRLRALVADMPANWLLLETDSPDQPPCGCQGRRNEPARLAQVVLEVAMLRNEPPDALAATTTANACRLFGLPVPDQA